MKDIAPDVYRKRLLIEARYTIAVDEAVVTDFFRRASEALDLRMYSAPIVHSTGGLGKAENQGFDAFAPLVDSGISIYVWVAARFVSCIIFTCKDFSTDDAVRLFRDFFQTTELEYQEF